jgi:hypothetical protein
MMNHSFDYNGHVVAPSKPQKVLRKVVKRVQIDSSDRDVSKYYTNGDFVVYLPRTYERVTAIRLIGAEFPPLAVSSGVSTAGALKHSYTNGQNIRSTLYTQDRILNEYYYYFMIDLEGLNGLDETATGSNSSTFTDGSFAHIPVTTEVQANGTSYITYNNKSGPDNEVVLSPPRSIDRLRIRTRTHDQQGNQGFIYWTRDGQFANGQQSANNIDQTTCNVDINYTLLLEIEYLDNGFDEFSSFETRVGSRN